MSPRRRVDPAEPDYFEAPRPPAEPRPPRRWPLVAIGTTAVAVIAAAITASVFMLVAHESDRRTQVRDASALGYVRGFMTAYTTLDPYHANDYADRIMAAGTGEFEAGFREKLNDIVIQVAQAEPTTGEVLDAGVQRWNDPGSADVLVATKMASTTPDGKSTVESGSRWVVTVVQEGQQWKISRLIQVI